MCACLCVRWYVFYKGDVICTNIEYILMINNSDAGVHLLFGSLETLAHILPVDDIPDSLNIIRPHIFILKVVGMLPYINTKEGDET